MHRRSPSPIAVFAYFFYYFIVALNVVLIVGVPDGFTRGGFFGFSFKRMVNAKQKCEKKKKIKNVFVSPQDFRRALFFIHFFNAIFMDFARDDADGLRRCFPPSLFTLRSLHVQRCYSLADFNFFPLLSSFLYLHSVRLSKNVLYERTNAQCRIWFLDRRENVETFCNS